MVYAIALLSLFATVTGIFSKQGPGPSVYKSVRGHEITLYGHGVYHQMSAEVAPQGIAQDVITLFAGIPLLLISLYMFRKGSLKGKILLAGTLGYFLVTYLFYTLMAMYNSLFLVWLIILSFSFYGFLIAFSNISANELFKLSEEKFPYKSTGGFLMFSGIAISLLWLSIILPSTIHGTVPIETEHYTTLVVQALDLSILLPASFIAGLYTWKKKAYGFKLSSVYIVFLSILMTALTAKVIAMATLGYNVIPVIFIIPLFNVVSIICSIQCLNAVGNTRRIV